MKSFVLRGGQTTGDELLRGAQPAQLSSELNKSVHCGGLEIGHIRIGPAQFIALVKVELDVMEGPPTTVIGFGQEALYRSIYRRFLISTGDRHGQTAFVHFQFAPVLC
jgi:hypothetical protein